ncbi:MAG: HU family DNA-binding protein [Patescibacteria group bacterium]|jgi:nucleoid DNA-binding protein
MEKPELVAVISKNTGISEDEAIRIIDAFVETIKEGLLRGEKVTISGFGTFLLSKRKAKTFINPKTQRAHEIPEKFLPHFKAGSDFRA